MRSKLKLILWTIGIFAGLSLFLNIFSTGPEVAGISTELPTPTNAVVYIPTDTPTPTLIPTNTPTIVQKTLPAASANIPGNGDPTQIGKMIQSMYPEYSNIDPKVLGQLWINKHSQHITSGGTGSAPAGATARCADNTLSFSTHHSGTCSHHGGVAQWL